MCLLFTVSTLSAKENIGSDKTNTTISESGKVTSDCIPATSTAELNVNNVRCMLLGGGDLWWDTNNAKYEVPKIDQGSGETGKHSIFAGALWIGGIDALGQLKVAAMTYRQTGNDFFPGPLNGNGETNRATCTSYDRFWEVTKEDIDDFLNTVDLNGGVAPKSLVPPSILGWPARNNPYFEEVNGFELPEDKNLAPFWDANNDLDYDPQDGDYPVINSDIEGIYGDQMIWWVFNDKGNFHSETGGQAIGLEVSALAFAFATNDEVNNMTFYKYVVDNKSTADLNDTYFGQWVDPDLGNYLDDYVGCVPEESLGIVYNGDALDDGTAGYGEDIPMLAVDFFKGPNDEDGNQLGMSSFLFYNNDFTVQGNPETATHFYNYLSGFWKDGTPFVKPGTDGDGYGEGDPWPFMFDGSPTAPQPAWSECSWNIQPADRRFLQVSGPFTLKPGAVNDVIVGVVWTRDGLTYPCPSFEPIITADKKAQALFDSNFKLLNGPDAPNLTIREMDQELILSVWNSTSSNNYLESYAEADAVLAAAKDPDSLYVFQGYRIYQLKDGTVTSADYENPDLAREIFQVDVKDGVGTIINDIFSADVNALIPTVMVDGEDAGIAHTFRVSDDQFATGDKKLVNHKAYYFSVVAYAYNAKDDFEINYLLGRNNIRRYTAVPHKIDPEFSGTVVNSSFGDGPAITKINGLGNSANYLELDESTIEEIIVNGSVDQPVYQPGFGPVDVKIYDPVFVPNAKFRLKFEDSAYFNVGQPNCGAVSVGEDNVLEYVDTDECSKFQEFTYEILDEAGNSDIACVSLLSEFALPDDLHAFCDTRVIHSPSSIKKVTINVIENDVYTDQSQTTGNEITVDIESSPVNGTAIIIDSDIDNGVVDIEYTANDGFYGLDIFQYSLNEGTNKSIATVYVNVQNEDTQDLLDAADDQYFLNFGEQITTLNNDVSNLNGTSIISGASTWLLEVVEADDVKIQGKTYQAEKQIKFVNEQAIGGYEVNPSAEQTDPDGYYEYAYPLGFSLGVQQAINPDKGDALISAEMEFESVQTSWLNVISDEEGISSFNWIRSGDITDNTGFWDYVCFNKLSGIDLESYYEGILSGGVAPYCLTANVPNTVQPFPGEPDKTIMMSPACSDCGLAQSGDDCWRTLLNTEVVPPDNNLGSLFSFDLVMTDDKSKWTKCVVVDVARDSENSVGGAVKNGMRKSPSLDKEGNEISGEMGRSWFPGYAIDLESGKRLNIIFSENSFIKSENGADMIWNPTSTLSVGTGSIPGALDLNNFRAAGEHYIYVMTSEYDEGDSYHATLSQEEDYVDYAYVPGTGLTVNLTYEANKRSVYADAAWVVAPQLVNGFQMKSMADGLVPAEAKIKVRVSRSYEADSEGNLPEYEFDFTRFASETNISEVAESALDIVNVVPNPYYAISDYEDSKFDNTIKITNLPARTVVRIFSLDGTMVRQLEIDNRSLESTGGTSLSTKAGTTENAITWDLKNHKGIPVASGMYIINVEAPDLGLSKNLKWFGAIRPIDLETF